MEIHPRPREQHSRRLRTVRLVPVRTVPARINPQPIAVPVAPTPMEPIAIGPEQPYPVAIPHDNSPAARARRARRKLRRLFEEARRAAKGQARLGRDHEYQLLKCAYGAVRRWKREGVGQEIERELRAEAQVPISRMSSLFLVLLRSALPRLDGKRASKMALALAAADDQGGYGQAAGRLFVAQWRDRGCSPPARLGGQASFIRQWVACPLDLATAWLHSPAAQRATVPMGVAANSGFDPPREVRRHSMSLRSEPFRETRCRNR